MIKVVAWPILKVLPKPTWPYLEMMEMFMFNFCWQRAISSTYMGNFLLSPVYCLPLVWLEKTHVLKWILAMGHDDGNCYRHLQAEHFVKGSKCWLGAHSAERRFYCIWYLNLVLSWWTVGGNEKCTWSPLKAFGSVCFVFFVLRFQGQDFLTWGRVCLWMWLQVS